MNTLQLRRVLRSDPVISQTMHSDVLPCDLLPKKKVLNKTLYVVNEDPSTLPGSHWSCVHVDPHKMITIFFDSYGRPPSNHYIKKFINVNNTKYFQYSKQNLQGECSNTCAAYCLFFAYHIARRKSLHTILKHFNDRTKNNNDKKVVKFVRMIYKHTFPTTRVNSVCYPRRFHATFNI